MPTATELGVDSVTDVVLNVYNIEGDITGDELACLCPNPQHPDRRPSCSVNLEKGFFHCWSCGIAGDLARLGEIVLNLPRDAVLDMLKPNTAESLVNIVRRRVGELLHREKPVRVALGGPYKPLDPRYLSGRGFTPETLKRWGLRFVREETLERSDGRTFTIGNSIAIPIRDARGRLHAWCYRRTENSPSWQPKYLYTPGVSLSNTWFGFHIHRSARYVVVVEGALDTIWLDQLGVPAVGMLGSTNLSDSKVLQLQQFPTVYLFGDRDAAGAAAVGRLGEILSNRTFVKVVRYRSWMVGKDPQELAPVDVELALEQALPWFIWKQRGHPS